MRNLHSRTRFGRFATVALALVFLAVAVAGCVHPDDNEPRVRDNPPRTSPPPGIMDPDLGGTIDGNVTLEPPEPDVTLSLNATLVGWAQESNFTFDARATIVAHGNITMWSFELGDGTTVTLTGDDDPIVTHTYERGGTFTVNLTVEVEGADLNATVHATKSLVVFVHERHEIMPGNLQTSLLGGNTVALVPFPVRAGGVHVRTGLDIQNTALVGGASGVVVILDPDEEIVAEAAFSVPAGQTRNVSLENSLNLTGEHIVRVQLTSGQVRFSGSTEVYYGLPPEDESEE